MESTDKAKGTGVAVRFPLHSSYCPEHRFVRATGKVTWAVRKVVQDFSRETGVKASKSQDQEDLRKCLCLWTTYSSDGSSFLPNEVQC